MIIYCRATLSIRQRLLWQMVNVPKNFLRCQEYLKDQFLDCFLIFLVYINKVTSQVSDGSYTVLFSDDIALYRIILPHNDNVYLQSDIKSISDWAEDHHLSLHSGKCCAVLLTRKRSACYHSFTLKGNPLNFIDHYKYLRLIFCPTLSWSDHINLICRQGD